jgi:hypothetical protein
LQEEKLAKNKSSTPSTAGKKALKETSSAISKQQKKEIAVNKTSKRPTRKRSKRNTKETPRSNPCAMDNPNYKFGKSLLTLWSHFGPRAVHGSEMVKRTAAATCATQ